MNLPFFSVVIPTYNRSDFLKSAVASVLSQTCIDFELLIVDDGSTDKTPSLVAGYQDARIVYVPQSHQGVSAARNAGIRASRGPWIAFLDSDDCFAPDKLTRAREYINKFPNFSVFHTEEIWYRNNQLLNQKTIHRKPEGDVFAQALRLCCISPSTAVIRKNVFDSTGFFDESLPACEDYDFWLRVSARLAVKLIPEVLTIKQGGHSDQLSRRYPGAMDTFRIKAITKLLDAGILSEAQRLLAITELQNKCRIYIAGAQKRRKDNEVKEYTELMRAYGA